MNTSSKTFVGLVLIVVSSAGLAMAGRGGGGRAGGGGSRGGGGGHAGGGASHAAGGGFHAAGGASRAATFHTPSFSTPHQTFNAPRESFNAPRESFNAPRESFNAPRESFNVPRMAETPAFRPALPHNGGAGHPAITPGSRPGLGERPGVAATPAWDNRLNPANRPGMENRADIGNRAYIANRPNLGDNVGINRTNNLVRPTHGDWNRGDWYHGDWHGNWNNSWYYRPLGWWTAGYWAGAALSAVPWSWGYWSYYNPYCTGPVVDDGTSIDYSQPIVLAQPAALPPGDGGLTAEQQAGPLLDAARAAFMQGDYQTALAQADQAIALVPNDTVLHEFRGLALFALGRYKEAAAADYAVLSAGPGWDWTTLSGLYPSVDVYTEQLRALEHYAKTHPAASEARFLLAYHYLTCGYSAAAAAQLKQVVQLNPQDQLSAQLLSSLSTVNTSAADFAEPAQGFAEPAAGLAEPAAGLAEPAAGLAEPAAGLAEPAADIAEPAAGGPPAKRVDAASLVGKWTATRADRATIKLALGADGKFTWELDQNGKPQQFRGTYTVADNLLVLKQGEHPMMVGQVAPLAADRFNFKLAGDNPSDPGLTFAR